MDPLVTAELRNYESSPLYRLPEELLDMVLNELSSDNDLVSLFCLRHVSRLLRRLVAGNPTFKKASSPLLEGNYKVLCQATKIREKATGNTHQDGTNWADWRLSPRILKSFGLTDRVNLRDLLKRDRLCSNCLAESGLARLPCNGCDLYSLRRNLHSTAVWCTGCREPHNPMAYSVAQRTSERPICAAREVFVRLCEHKVIRWGQIEEILRNHLGPMVLKGNEKRALRIYRYSQSGEMVIDQCNECLDLGPCSLSSATGTDAKTGVLRGPRAVLKYNCDEKAIPSYLELEWRVHKMLQVHKDGRLDSLELRSMFDTYRNSSPVRWIAPDGLQGSLSLPEMRCFDPAVCDCVLYNGDLDNRTTFLEKARQMTAKSSSEVDPRQLWRSPFPGRHSVQLSQDGHVSTGPCPAQIRQWEITLTTGKPAPPVMAACFETTYSCAIPLQRFSNPPYSFSRIGLPQGLFNPSQPWYHAIDPDSYSIGSDHEQPASSSTKDSDDDNLKDTAVSAPKKKPSLWPSCREPGCKNNHETKRRTECKWLRTSLYGCAQFDGISERREEEFSRVSPATERMLYEPPASMPK